MVVKEILNCCGACIFNKRDGIEIKQNKERLKKCQSFH
jgi:hypothetical protein